jgi:hypothetical protein
MAAPAPRVLAALLWACVWQLAVVEGQFNPYNVAVDRKLPDDNLEGVLVGQDVLTMIMGNRVVAGPGKIRIYRSADHSLRQEIEMADTSKVRVLPYKGAPAHIRCAGAIVRSACAWL